MKSSLWVIWSVALLCFGSVRCNSYDDDFLDITRSEDREHTEKLQDIERKLYNARQVWNEVANEINELSRMQNPQEALQCELICQNNGECKIKDDGSQVCQCTKQFTGKLCETPLPCELICQNNGECKIKDDGSQVCQCTKQFTGKLCETPICDPVCKNGGECEAKEDGSPGCRCPKDYSGRTCETLPDNLCKSSIKNCIETSGTCVTKDDGKVQCECTEDKEYKADDGCQNKPDFCEEVCGDLEKVTCSGDKTVKTKVTCTCKDKKKDFDTKEKTCKVDHCKEKCGETNKVICKGNRFEENEVKCECKNQEQDFDEDKTCKTNYCRKVCGDGDHIKCENKFKTKTTKDCSCDDEGYKFTAKKCQKKCSEDGDCNGKGSCKGNENEKLCKCIDGITGDTCDVIVACQTGGTFENCKGDRGDCTFEDGKAKCECSGEKKLYNGKYCADTCEKDTDCEGSNRECVQDGSKSTKFCICKKGFEGDDCKVITGCKDLKEKCDQIETECIFDKDSPGMATCKCKDGYFYDREENKCKDQYCNPNNPCEDGECTHDESAGSGFCKCPENKYYNYESNKCEDLPDKCVLRTCDEHFKCDKGECKCKYELTEGECKPNCKPNPCFPDAKCEDGSCSCEEGKYYKDKRCKDAKCALDKYKEKCKCPDGFARKEGSEECEPKTGEACSLECGYGLCIKQNEKSKETCKCFEFAKPGNDKCILKQDYCPGKLQKDSMKCECKGQYKQADDGVTCKLKTCEDDDVKKECEAKGAPCEMDWKNNGYSCKCPKGYDFGANGKCTDSCSIEKNVETCAQLGKSCFNGFSDSNEKTIICSCPPTVKEVNGKCTGKAEFVYLIKNIPVLKKRYEIKSGINKVLLNNDLFQSMKKTFDKSLFDYGYLYDYKITGDVVSCSVWVNFKAPPKEQELKKINLLSQKFTLKDCADCSAVVWPPSLLLSEKGLKEVEVTKLDFCKNEIRDLFCGKGSECKDNKCSCRDGFKVIPESIREIKDAAYHVVRCEDIDECAEGIDNCPGNTQCVNTYGSWKCVCKKGFKKEKEPEDPETDKSDCSEMCTPSPCKKGKCTLNEDKSFNCECEAGVGGSLCDRADPNYASAKKGTVVVGAVLGTILAVAAVAFLYYIIKRRGGLCVE